MDGPTLPYLLAIGPPLLKPYLKDSKPTIGVVVNALLFGAIVWGLNDVSPKLATAFTWVAATTSVLTNGADVMRAINPTGRTTRKVTKDA